MVAIVELLLKEVVVEANIVETVFGSRTKLLDEIERLRKSQEKAEWQLKIAHDVLLNYGPAAEEARRVADALSVIDEHYQSRRHKQAAENS
jgi:hypothetical protein